MLLTRLNLIIVFALIIIVITAYLLRIFTVLDPRAFLLGTLKRTQLPICADIALINPIFTS